eukprot:11507237-Alexandrium_andersonii.AAC.1
MTPRGQSAQPGCQAPAPQYSRRPGGGGSNGHGTSRFPSASPTVLAALVALGGARVELAGLL